jgi:uncharacterized protein YigE (DUF2233 family)
VNAIRVLGLLILVASGVFAQSHRVERGGTVFLTYVVASEKVSLFWKDPSTGQPFHRFSNLQKYLEQNHKRIRFMMNGGIFEEHGIPSGLLVIDGQTLLPLNTNPGKGNFFLQPSGVFYIDSQGAHVVATSEYSRRNPKPRLAVQSGPLLLADGKTHPAFRRESTNYLHRNGVGIREKDGAVIFAITEFGQSRYANLFEFADFFRSQGCRNALFLDGDISQMKVDPDGPVTPINTFGSIFSVFE